MESVSTKNSPCNKYPQYTCVMRNIYQHYVDKYNCSIYFIKDGIDIHGEYDYCNISIHVEFHENFNQMYEENLKSCPKAFGCIHKGYTLSVKRESRLNKFARIHVIFSNPIVEYVIEEVSYDLQSLIGEVGGTMGLTVGLSFLSIFEWALDLVKNYLV